MPLKPQCLKAIIINSDSPVLGLADPGSTEFAGLGSELQFGSRLAPLCLSLFEAVGY